MSYTILIADDEAEIRDLLRLYLENEHYTILEAADGDEALRLFRDSHVDLCLLDIMMPGTDGYHVLKELRRTSNLPVLMLSAKDQDADKILGLNLGADDYITKPFNPVTLGAKVKALIRRSRNALPGTGNIITAGPFTYNTSTLRFYKNDTEIFLSSKENAIMKLFMDNVNRVFSKDMLYELVWGDAIIDENTVMVYVNRLRQKIEDDPSNPKYLKNIRGLGYRFIV